MIYTKINHSIIKMFILYVFLYIILTLKLQYSKNDKIIADPFPSNQGLIL